MSESDGGGDPETSCKNVLINKAAQAAASKIDVLVCGQCHYVFHFVEEFVEHKNREKCGKPAFRTSISEDKPQVWAFLLWKSTVSLKEKESSWALYQRWCKLDTDVRSAWTAAGQAIRQCTSLSVEAGENINKIESQSETTLNKSSSMASEAESEAELGATLSDDESANDKEPEKSPEKSEEVVITKRKRGRPRRDGQTPKAEPAETPPTTGQRGRPRKVLITQVEKVPEEKVTIKKEPLTDESPPKEDKKTGLRVIKMTRSTATLLKTIKPGPKKRLISESEDASTSSTPKKNPMATRSKKKGEESEDDDFVVEKILAKRLNQKTKEYEYLLKWEGYPHEQNTWEPIHNMKECDTLVENFERSLAKQKANQQAAGHKVITKVIKMPSKQVVVAGPSVEPRPIRSSKVKAMENVKSWCGSMGKRKGDDDSDSDESTSGKRIKVEPSSDHMDEGSADELDDKKTPGLLKSLALVKSPVGNIKKQLIASIAMNGMSKSDPVKKSLVKSPVTQPPVLVANSKGIIKLDSRQVPNLSSGVYIVSNQAGIVKLNSQTSTALGNSMQTSQKAVTSGVVRKIATQLSPKQVVPSSEVKISTPDVKLLPKGSPSGLVRIPPTSNLARKRSPLAPLTGPRPLRVLGPRPLAVLQQRPGLKPGQRPPFVPRPPQVLRPPIRPSFPAGPRILMKPNTSPAAQVKSGMRPIQAMLGGSMSSSQNVITVSMAQSGTDHGVTPLQTSLTQKLLIPIKGKKLAAKLSPPIVLGPNGKQRDSKLVESDSLHMEFQEVESSSSDDDGVESLPELPPGELPSPPGSPLPLTLCPLTGKILGRAEGEPTPPPSPEPSQILPDLDGGDEDCLKVEMSPGGTTGTVVNMGGQPFDDPMDSLHADGVTVTKLMSNEGGSDGDEEEAEQEYVTITGEDGVVYQMVTHGNNLMEGQVLMGDDGQQMYVTGTQDQQLTLDTAVAEAVSQLMPGDGDESQDMGDDSTQAQVVAQIVEEGETTPGGMRRVVLLLPDGNFMMTEVDEDQYAALDLDSSDTSPTK